MSQSDTFVTSSFKGAGNATKDATICIISKTISVSLRFPSSPWYNQLSRSNPPSAYFFPTFPLTKGSLLWSDFEVIDSGLSGGEESTSTGASFFTFTSDEVCRLMSKATELDASCWERHRIRFTILLKGKRTENMAYYKTQVHEILLYMQHTNV